MYGLCKGNAPKATNKVAILNFYLLKIQKMYSVNNF